MMWMGGRRWQARPTRTSISMARARPAPAARWAMSRASIRSTSARPDLSKSAAPVAQPSEKGERVRQLFRHALHACFQALETHHILYAPVEKRPCILMVFRSIGKPVKRYRREDPGERCAFRTKIDISGCVSRRAPDRIPRAIKRARPRPAGTRQREQRHRAAHRLAMENINLEPRPHRMSDPFTDFH